MALQSIPIPPDAKRDAKAVELAKNAHTWPVETLRKPHGAFQAGDQFRVTPNGYRVNAVVCECPDYIDWGHICKHIRAICLMERPFPIRTVRARYEEVFGVCDARSCDEDRARGERYCDRHVLVDCF